MFKILQIISLIILMISIGIISLPVRPLYDKIFKLILSFIFALFLTLQIISIYTIGGFIDYQFFIHFNLDALPIALDKFFIQIVVYIPLFIMVLTVVMFFMFKKVQHYVFNKLKLPTYLL